jgi:D-alanyl-D-alanine carboxypeptidase/D-alanyl-D-alanine-endopeptidase (penicillin-binding protein 4)
MSCRQIASLVLLFGVVVAGTHAQPTALDSTERARLSTAITDTIEAKPFVGAWWGVQVTNLATGAVLYQRHADRSFVPASNVKLLTAAAALDRLGPDYRYKTTLYADGPVRNGVLEGNLIVDGSGDPTLGGHHQRTDPTKTLRRWADSLERAGIRRIEGDVIGVDDPFSDEPMGPSWNWDWVPYSFAAEPNGLVFNGNTIDVEVAGRRPGGSAWVTWRPVRTDFVKVRNQTRTVPPDSSTGGSVERPLGTNRIQVGTEIHPSDIDTMAVSITDPTRYVAHVLRDVLVEQGVSVRGEPKDADDLSIKPDVNAVEMRPVATYRSPPLRKIVRTMNHESHNLYAEQLLRTMAVVNAPDTTDEDLKHGSAALGVLAVRSSLAETGIDTSRVFLQGGSGLSRKNLASPRAFVRLLEHVWTEADTTTRSAFTESLPRGGEEGTLEYRFDEGAPAGGRVRAKTGTLTGVSALSGYVETEGGVPLAFSILCNHHMTDSDQVRSAQDAIVNALAELPLSAP